MAISIILNIDSTQYDITNDVVKDSLKISYSLFKDLEPTTNKLDLRILGTSSVIPLLMNTNGTIQIQVLDGATYYFTGYVTSNYTWEITNRGKQPILLSAEDPGIKLLKRSWISSNGLYTLYNNLKICDPLDTNNSIIHSIAALTGVSVDSSIPTITTLLSLNIQDKDNKTFWEVMDDICYEYGYVFYFTEEGKLNLYKIPKSSVTPTNTFSTSTNIISEFDNKGFDIKKQLQQYKQIILTWDEWETKNDIYVFRDSTNGDNAYDCNIELAPGAYYPEGADANTYVYSEYKSETGQEIINVNTAVLEYVVDSGITVEFENLGTRGKLRIKNNSAIAANIRKLKVKGTSVVLKKNTNVTKAGETTSPIFKYRAKYIHDLTSANNFINTVKDHYNYSNYTYTFKSKADVDLGSIATIVDTTWNTVNENVLIISKELKGNGVITYTAIGIDAFNLSAEVTRDITLYTDNNLQSIAVPRIITPSITIGETEVKLGESVTTVNGVTVNGTVEGNAETASKLLNARTIGLSGKVGGTATAFDGTTNITIDVNSAAITSAEVTDATNANTVNKIVKRDASGNFSAGTITASLSGNASTATKLATARTIGISGKVTGTATNFDGSSNITISTTAANITSAEVSDATASNTASTIVKRDSAGGFNAGAINASGNVTIGGDLVVNGTTFTLNSSTLTIDDPIITLGGDTAPTIDDNKDKGIEFRWHNGTAAKVGFFGFDDSSGKFTFIPDATNASEVFSGTKGALDANIAWTDVTGKPTTISGYGITDIGNGTLTVNTSGTGLSGSGTFTANQSSNNTITITSNATSANTASAIVARDASGNFSAGTITGTLSGNASTATTLQTARNIAGVSFNGSANIDIPFTNLTSKPTTLAGYGITDASPSSHIGTTGSSHGVVTTSVNGFMSSTDKTKLDGIAAGANNYVHPTGDGNLHVPATSTTNNLKVLKAGATAGSIAWGNVAFSELASIPTTLAGYGITDASLSTHTHAFSAITSKPTTLSGYGITDAATSTHTHTDLTNATASNTASTIVKRDASGGFIAGKIKGNNFYTGYDWTSKTAGYHCGTDGITGGLSFYDGTLATSASIFRDTDSKFYVGVRAAVLTNGITIDTAGNVGIKNTSPTSELDVTGTVKATSFSGPLSGNASTATTLQTARTINGVSFNGSANITITAANPKGITFNNSGSGAVSGTTYTGASTATISYNTIGAASSGHTHTDLTNATSLNTVSTLVKRDASGNFSAGTISATNLAGTLTTATQTNITSLGTLTSLTVNGNISQTGSTCGISNAFVSGALGTGWKIDYNSTVPSKSYLEVDNLMVRDTIRTHIFQKDVVKAINGQLYVSTSGVVADDFVGNYPTEKTIYFDQDKSSTFSVNDLILIKDTSITTGLISPYAKLRIDTIGTAANGKQPYTFTLIEGSISLAPPNIQKGMTAVKVSGGSILLDASSANNPFIDVIDNGTVKARLGNLAGISGASGYGLYSDNVFLTGKMTATSGKIGNWNIDATALYGGGYDASGNNPDNLPGTYLASNGSISANTATFKNITIEGDSSFEGTIDTPVLKVQFISTDLENWVTPAAPWSGEVLYQYFISLSAGRVVPCSGTFGGRTVTSIIRRDNSIDIAVTTAPSWYYIYRDQNYSYVGNLDATVEGRLQTISLTPLDFQQGVYDITGYKTIDCVNLRGDTLNVGANADTKMTLSSGNIMLGSVIHNGHNKIDIDGNINLISNITTWNSTASWTGSSFYDFFDKAIIGASGNGAWCTYDSVFNGQTVGRIDTYNNTVRIIAPNSTLLYTIINDSTTYTYQGTIKAISKTILNSPLAITGGLYGSVYGGLIASFNYDGDTDLKPKHLLIQSGGISVKGNETNADFSLYSQGTGNIYLNRDSAYSTGSVVIASTAVPTEKLEVGGNIKALNGRFISTIATGTSPLSVTSTTINTNLNSDYLDGRHGSYYTTAGNLSGTIPSAVLGNSTHYIGTTAIALNRASGAQSLTGITSIDGSAAKLTTARTIAGVSFDGSANISIPFANLSSKPTTLSGYGITDAAASSHVGATGAAHGVATTSVNGFMSSTDKTKLDGVATGANNYTLPMASVYVLGGVKIGTGVSIDGNGAISVSTTYQAPLTGTGFVKSSAGVISYDSNTYITGNQSISISGDAAGSGTTSIALTLANSGVTTGTYKSVTVDAKGRVTAGTNPTTLSGYGITDAATSTHTHAFSAITSKPTTLSGYGITDAAPSSHVGATGTAHGAVTTSVAGFMSAADKTKLDGIATGANLYTHPTGDGNLHVPATGTTNNTKILKAGSTAGSIAWGTVAFSELASKPTTLSGYGIIDASASTHNHTLDSLSNVTITSNSAGEILKWDATSSKWINNTLAEAGIQPAGSYLTGNQAITVTGDASGSGTTAISLTLATSGVTAGTYKSVTVDTKGRVTSGTNPTTLSGYGITDAATSTHTHTFASLTSKPTTLSGYGITDFVGFVAPFAGTSAPAGWLACNGQAVSRTTYSSLFAAIGTTWGVGDGTTTFNLPDLRETTLVGTGTRGSGVVEHDTYTVGQFKDDQIQNHKHNAYAVNNYISNSNSGGSGYPLVTGLSDITAPVEISGYGIPRVGTTTHGKQTGILWCIKY